MPLLSPSRNPPKKTVKPKLWGDNFLRLVLAMREGGGAGDPPPAPREGNLRPQSSPPLSLLFHPDQPHFSFLSQDLDQQVWVVSSKGRALWGGLILVRVFIIIGL